MKKGRVPNSPPDLLGKLFVSVIIPYLFFGDKSDPALQYHGTTSRKRTYKIDKF